MFSLVFLFLFAGLLFVFPVRALGNVLIVSNSSYYDILNTFWIVGEVQNTGDMSTQFTKITATLYNSTNQVIDIEYGYADLDVLLPNTKSPFAILCSSQDALNVHNYSLSVSWTDYAAGKPAGLAIVSNSSFVDGSNNMHVTGQIKNQGALTARFVQAIVTYYDASGKVVGVDSSYTDPTNLSPNQTGNYDTQLIYTQQVAKVAGYSVTAQSIEYAYNPSPSTAPTPSATAQPPTASPTANVSPSTNPTQNPTNTQTNNPSQTTEQTSTPTETKSPSPSPTIPELPITMALLIAIFATSIGSIVSKKIQCRQIHL